MPWFLEADSLGWVMPYRRDSRSSTCIVHAIAGYQGCSVAWLVPVSKGRLISESQAGEEGDRRARPLYLIS